MIGGESYVHVLSYEEEFFRFELNSRNEEEDEDDEE